LTRGLLKLEGTGEPVNSITYANNIMSLVSIQDYHQVSISLSQLC